MNRLGKAQKKDTQIGRPYIRFSCKIKLVDLNYKVVG